MSSAVCPNCNKSFEFNTAIDCFLRVRQKNDNKPAICVWNYKKTCSHCNTELRMKIGGQAENNGKWFVFIPKI